MSSPEASNAPRSPIMSSRHLAWALDEKNFNTIPIHPGPDGCLIQSSRREYGGDPHKTISEATPDITPPDSDHRPLILPLTPAETHSPIDEPDHRGRSPVIDVKSEKPRRRSTIPTIRTNLGLDAEAPIMESHRIDNGRTWSIVRTIFREPLAEFFGTFVMVLFGDGSVAQVLLGSGQKNAPDGFGYGEYQSINWGWGLGAMLGIYVAGDSGGYLNPAVTLCFCIFRKLPWRRLPIYVLAQMLGGLCAAAVIYGNYITGIDEHEGHGVRTVPPAPRATAGIFATYPQGFLTKPSQFFSDFIASTILMFVIFALKDGSNPGEAGRSGARQMFPIALLFLIFGLGACFGWETGYAINVARDLGPRVMCCIVGYGSEVWTAGEYYFWVPMVAPVCGTIFGGLLYDLSIYTGPESPVNMSWRGFRFLLRGGYWRARKERGSFEA